MNARRPTLRLAFALLAALVVTPAARAAEPPPRRTTGLALTPSELVVSVGLQDLFGPDERERLKSGFVTRVLVRIALQPEGSSEPVAIAFQRAEIVYDIWDERFRVRLTRGIKAKGHVSFDVAKTAANLAAKFVCDEAIQIHGGYGYSLSLIHI